MLESSRKKRLKGNSMQFFEKKKNFDIIIIIMYFIHQRLVIVQIKKHSLH